MTKKKISLIQAIVQLIALASVFIPISFIRYFTRLEDDWYSVKTFQYSESVFSATDMSNNLLWGVLLIAASALSLIYFILYSSTNARFVRKFSCTVITILPLIILGACVYIIENATNSYLKSSEVFGTDWGFYLVCALYLSIFILELFKRFSGIDEEAQHKSAKTTTFIQPRSPAEELAKYKVLFDHGIISAQEYEAKKRQLLNL